RAARRVERKAARDEERVELAEAAERRQSIHGNREMVDAETKRSQPRRVLALGEQRLVGRARYPPRPTGPRQIRARGESGWHLRDEPGDRLLRARRQLADAQLADEDLRRAAIGMAPVARDQLLVVEAIAIGLWDIAGRLERTR